MGSNPILSAIKQKQPNRAAFVLFRRRECWFEPVVVLSATMGSHTAIAVSGVCVGTIALKANACDFAITFRALAVPHSLRKQKRNFCLPKVPFLLSKPQAWYGISRQAVFLVPLRLDAIHGVAVIPSSPWG